MYTFAYSIQILIMIGNRKEVKLEKKEWKEKKDSSWGNLYSKYKDKDDFPSIYIFFFLQNKKKTGFFGRPMPTNLMLEENWLTEIENSSAFVASVRGWILSSQCRVHVG